MRAERFPNAASPTALPTALPTASTRAPVRGPWLRLLSQVLQLAGPDVEFLHHVERPWASATFTGARHTIALAFEGDAIASGEAFIAALPEHEFAVPRHLVADAAVVEVQHRQAPARLSVEVELLMLEDC